MKRLFNIQCLLFWSFQERHQNLNLTSKRCLTSVAVDDCKNLRIQMQKQRTSAVTLLTVFFFQKLCHEKMGEITQKRFVVQKRQVSKKLFLFCNFCFARFFVTFSFFLKGKCTFIMLQINYQHIQRHFDLCKPLKKIAVIKID